MIDLFKIKNSIEVKFADIIEEISINKFLDFVREKLKKL